MANHHHRLIDLEEMSKSIGGSSLEVAGIGNGGRIVFRLHEGWSDPLFRRESGKTVAVGWTDGPRRVGLWPGRRRWVAGGGRAGRVGAAGFAGRQEGLRGFPELSGIFRKNETIFDFFSIYRKIPNFERP